MSHKASSRPPLPGHTRTVSTDTRGHDCPDGKTNQASAFVQANHKVVMREMNRKTGQWLPLLKQLKDAFDELKSPVRIELPSNGSRLIVEYVPRSGGIPSRESLVAVELGKSPSKTAVRRPHKCPECGQRFVQKAWLNNHIKRKHPKARNTASE